MRNFKSIGSAFLSLLLLLIATSCETEGRVIIRTPLVLLTASVQENPYTGQVGEFIDFDFQAEVPGLFDKFTIVERIDGINTTLVEVTKANTPTLAGVDFYRNQYQYDLTQSGKAIELIWGIEDESGNVAFNSWFILIE